MAILVVEVWQVDIRPVVFVWAAELLAQSQPRTVATPALPCFGVSLR